MNDKIKICLPTIKRVPMYYRLLQKLHKQQQEHVSSAFIADYLGLEAIVVRKDMSNIGVVGKPRIGFNVAGTIKIIESITNYSNPNEAFLVGVGHLGQALLGYNGFVDMGLSIIAGFDSNPEIIGQKIYGKEIFDIQSFSRLTRRLNIRAGILCVPEPAAQETTDLMVEAGIEGIWNFTPTKLKVPEGVVVQREDLAEGLSVLMVKMNEK